MESNKPRESLRNTLRKLRERVDEKWQQCSEAERADETQNVVRDVFNDEVEVEGELEELCSLAQTLSEQTKIINPRAFRKWIIGTGQSNSRSKILATILSEGDAYLLNIWPRLVERLTDNHHAFSDGALPYTSAEVSTYFGTDPHPRFLKGQYRFCPVNLSRISFDLDETREKLRKSVGDKAMVKCLAYDKSGVTEVQRVADTWCPASRLRDVFKDEQRTLKELFLGWQRLRQPKDVIHDPERLRAYYEEVLRKADVFCGRVRSRERLLATLVFSAVLSSRSPAWDTFMEHCLRIGPDSACQSKTLTDEMLPFTMSDALKYFGTDGENVYSAQLRFCPLRIEHGKEVDWIEESPPVLPLHEKVYIDGGFYGNVFRVEVSAGYFDEHHNTQLAMKVIEGDSKFKNTEWRFAQKVTERENTNGGIMVPIALVRWQANTYIFMHLASCNLETLMKGNVRREKCGPAIGQLVRDTTQDDEDMERHCKSLVPTDFDSRLNRLCWMEGMAETLRVLHKTIRNDKDQMRRGIVLHGDVKTANILYTRGKKHHPLQLSDFGISMFKYAQQQVFREDQTTVSSSSSRDARSQLHLSPKCPNFPPEAEKDRLVGESADIWGYGLVFADFLAWISGGPQALKDFQQARDPKDNPYHPDYALLSFYRNDNQELKLKDGIEQWFDALIQRTKNEREKVLYESCWHLLRHGLLRCDPKERLDADDLCKAVREILDQQPVKVLEKLLKDSSNKRNTVDEHSAADSRAASTYASVDLQNNDHTSAETSHADSSESSKTVDSTPSGSIGTQEVEVQSTHSQNPKGKARDTHVRADSKVDEPQSPQTTAVGDSKKSSASSSRQDSMSSSMSSGSLGAQPSMSSLESTRSNATALRVFEKLRADEADEAAALIDQGANLDWKNEQGDTLLHFAVWCTSTAATNALLTSRPRLAIKQNTAKESALHWCAKSDLDSAPDHAELIIQTNPKARRLPDRQGNNALAWASKKRRKALVKMLNDEP